MMSDDKGRHCGLLILFRDHADAVRGKSPEVTENCEIYNYGAPHLCVAWLSK